MTRETKQGIQRRLKKARVGIAGVGGLGSNAAVALARAGVGHLILVDFDRVEESNLDRQYYFYNQVGQLKVEALKATLKHINPHILIDIYPVKLEEGSMDTFFKDVDVVIEALDHAQTKTVFIEEILMKLPGKHVVAASGVAGYGNPDRIRTLHTGHLHLCYNESAKSSEEDVLMAPHVALMANWEADLALEIILGGGH